jgi:hypothetical protein
VLFGLNQVTTNTPSIIISKNGSNKVDVFGSMEPSTSTLFDPFLLLVRDGRIIIFLS